MDQRDKVPNIAKQFDQTYSEDNNNMKAGKELLDLNKESTQTQEVIKINNKDLDLLKNELDMPQEEATKLLIKYKGDIKAAIKHFLTDFSFKQEDF